MTRKISKIECCTDVRNLPKEMEKALNDAGGLDNVRKNIPDRDVLASEATRHQVLSDPIRLQILHSLLVSDLCPCILKEITELSDSKLSYHLNVLEKEGLIVSSPRQRWRIYAITELGLSHISH